jgi:2-methylcitrate dehydratase PrpD
MTIPPDALTHALARYVVDPGHGAAQAAACAVARSGFIDTVATMLAAANEPVVRLMLEHLGAQGGPAEAPVPFAGRMLSAPQAACVNGVAGHALDYDDVALSAHTSTVLVPAILAEGYRLRVSGQEALRAYVVGYEVWAELYSREAEQYHLKGWHPTGVFGTVGAAAAIAHLHRLSVAQTQTALAIAASMASGLVANFGTMTKPLHAGRAASCAIEAVRLAVLGLSAAPDALEHPAGFLAALSPSGRVDRARPVERLGCSPRILSLGLSIKRYPVCYSCHRVIDGVLALVEQEALSFDAVREVQVTIGPAQASMLRNHRPRTGLEARFSIEFAVAAALVARRVGLAQLDDDFVRRPEVQAQLDKVRIAITDRPCPIDPAFSYADRVRIRTGDGRQYDSGDIRFARGNAENPLDEDGLHRKFIDCASAGGTFGAPAALYARLAALEELADLRMLFANGEATPAPAEAPEISVH